MILLFVTIASTVTLQNENNNYEKIYKLYSIITKYHEKINILKQKIIKKEKEKQNAMKSIHYYYTQKNKIKIHYLIQ